MYVSRANAALCAVWVLKAALFGRMAVPCDMLIGIAGVQRPFWKAYFFCKWPAEMAGGCDPWRSLRGEGMGIWLFDGGEPSRYGYAAAEEACSSEQPLPIGRDLR